jgi:hypothetical protein
MKGTTLTDLGSSLVWRKSRRCDSSACVEVAVTSESVVLRNSQDPGGSVLHLSKDQWTAFIAFVQADGIQAG